jgi:pimeloyl-ACP methyl ester carboxylesterase
LADRLAYQVHPGTGPYLGLVHGFLSSSAQWQDNLAALAEVCRPVTIELWGHGQSPTPTNETAYLPEAYVDQLETIRHDLECERWFLCGYSIGAGLTIRYAHTYPEHVLGHLFTNSASGFADDDLIQKWRAEGQESAEKIITGGIKALERLPVHPRFARRLPGHIREALLADAKFLSPYAVAMVMKQTTTAVSIRDIAGSNPRPALMCHGIFEKRFAKSRDWAQNNMAKLEIVDLQAGHGVNMEDVSGFNHAATKFIAAHSLP